MKHPAPGTPWNSYIEQSGGPYGQYTSHAAVQEASGPVELRLDGTYATSEGWRDNSDYNLWQSNAYLGWRPDDKQLTAVDVHVSRFDGGDPGRLTFQQYQDDPTQSVSPYNHNWVDRYSVVLRHEHQFGDNWYVEAKAWYTHEDIDARAANSFSADPHTGETVLDANGHPIFPNNTVFAYEEFNNEGLDL